jgi:hypothetical protein
MVIRRVMMESQYKGYLSFDALFSILPIVLMLAYTLNISSFLAEDARDKVDSQVLFNKLVSVGDHVVKAGAAHHETSLFGKTTYYPNWITDNSLNSPDIAELGAKSGLSRLHVGFGKKENLSCIYRLVAYGDNQQNLQIKKLYICGDDYADD